MRRSPDSSSEIRQRRALNRICNVDDQSPKLLLWTDCPAHRHRPATHRNDPSFELNQHESLQSSIGRTAPECSVLRVPETNRWKERRRQWGVLSRMQTSSPRISLKDPVVESSRSRHASHFMLVFSGWRAPNQLGDQAGASAHLEVCRVDHDSMLQLLRSWRGLPSEPSMKFSRQ